MKNKSSQVKTRHHISFFFVFFFKIVTVHLLWMMSDDLNKSHHFHRATLFVLFVREESTMRHPHWVVRRLNGSFQLKQTGSSVLPWSPQGSSLWTVNKSSLRSQDWVWLSVTEPRGVDKSTLKQKTNSTYGLYLTELDDLITSDINTHIYTFLSQSVTVFVFQSGLMMEAAWMLMYHWHPRW